MIARSCWSSPRSHKYQANLPLFFFLIIIFKALGHMMPIAGKIFHSPKSSVKNHLQKRNPTVHYFYLLNTLLT